VDGQPQQQEHEQQQQQQEHEQQHTPPSEQQQRQRQQQWQQLRERSSRIDRDVKRTDRCGGRCAVTRSSLWVALPRSSSRHSGMHAAAPAKHATARSLSRRRRCCCRHHPFYSGPAAARRLRALRNVLRAYCCHDEAVGYCQVRRVAFCLCACACACECCAHVAPRACRQLHACARCQCRAHQHSLVARPATRTAGHERPGVAAAGGERGRRGGGGGCCLVAGRQPLSLRCAACARMRAAGAACVPCQQPRSTPAAPSIPWRTQPWRCTAGGRVLVLCGAHGPPGRQLCGGPARHAPAAARAAAARAGGWGGRCQGVAASVRTRGRRPGVCGCAAAWHPCWGGGGRSRHVGTHTHYTHYTHARRATALCRDAAPPRDTRRCWTRSCTPCWRSGAAWTTFSRSAGC
jgi:hypothetical protein